VVPPSGIVVTIDSPGAGAELSPNGNVTVSGVAYDTTATGGAGIDRVSVFLGDRDAGGVFWGDATLGQPSPQLGGDRTSAGYSRRSPTIPTGSGQRDIFVYARSSVSGREASTSIPVFLGTPPTPVRGQVPTAVVPQLPACTPTPVPTATPTNTPIPVPTFTPFPLNPTATPMPAAAAPAANPPAAEAPAPAPAPAAAPPAAAPAPAPAAPPPAAVGAAQGTAPRGGGIPPELGVLLLGAGAGVIGGGFALRRRERRGPPPRA
jgi:pyruvate/2-oxoglutarate dehydrogenase complex dihydrolipoamide acyltransferase (E2) component